MLVTSASVVADTEGMGLSTDNITDSYHNQPESLKEAVELEVELHAGYRN